MDCLLGGWCGDAIGAVLEFYNKKITKDIALYAIDMPGGGQLNVAPGQITDDSELEISLYSVLYDKDPNLGFPIEEVAQTYIKWYKSNPFDIGRTCAKAFSFCNNSTEMYNNAHKYNLLSEANGALMRAAAIAVWCRNQPIKKIIEYAHMDCLLSHPNEKCKECNALYCIAIVYLLNNPGDANGAYNLAFNYSKLTREWLNEEIKDCTINIGHIKHAFQLAFYHLKNKTSYKDAILDTLMRGGDTDTNAKIVGSMIGSLHGIANIPGHIIKTVINFDCYNYDVKKTLLGHNRPKDYSVKYLLEKLNTPTIFKS